LRSMSWQILICDEIVATGFEYESSFRQLINR
jgi:hypothetical protein